MLFKICEIITTILQAFLFVSITNSIAYKYNKLSKSKSYIAMVLIFLEIVMFTNIGINRSIANLSMILGVLLVLLIFFRKSIIDAFLGFGIFYLITTVSVYFLIAFYQSVIVNLGLDISGEMQFFIFIFIPAWAIYFTTFKSRKYIFKAASFIKNIRHGLIFVLIADLSIIFIDILRDDFFVKPMGLMFKSMVYLVAFVSFVFATFYFAKINDKSKEVEILNNALNDKIIELKKIKHDYGSEISGLYGLYQLDEIDRIGALLKGIVHRYQNLNDAISISEQATPLVSSILHSATSVGINVVAFDSADYDNIAIEESDLLKVLSNIIRNSIEMLETVQNPTIKYKSYNSYDDIVISISNNGPEIPEAIKYKIFHTGFSTKENKNNDRGYGLGIVKEIIDNCNGKIAVISDKEWTRFDIIIPNRK